ncbi:acyltransferase family protein [Tundrisphaera lichenicola]|uniref:acyltransferase family protein n=1 Tax=Tundrisphaera lichenicola TaxID=2029860 RepID=UPI003EB72C1B
MKTKRIAWVDYAKGVGITLVVLGHTLRGLQSSRIIADGPAFRSVDSWIYSFHMPLFFLLSGLFAERGVERGPGEFLRDRLSTIAYPYLIWSTLQTLVQVAVGRYTNHQTSLYDLAGILINPILQFWFLYALFLIGLIYYILRRCRLGPLGALSAFIAFWVSQRWISLGPWQPLSAARNNGVYYALGSVINHHGGTERIDRASSIALALTVLLGYGIVTTSVSRRWEEMMLIGLAVSLCGIAASIALSVLLSRVGGLGFVRILGTYSLEIYVAHTIASAALRIALQKLLKIQDVTTHLVIGTVGGIVLPLLLGLLCRRYHAEFLFRYPRRGTKLAERAA